MTDELERRRRQQPEEPEPREVELALEIARHLNPRSYDLIPPLIKEGLDGWADRGTPVGGFCTAVLANDLFRAVSNADPQSLAALPAIATYIINELPAGCSGSYERLRAWGAGGWRGEGEGLVHVLFQGVTMCGAGEGGFPWGDMPAVDQWVDLDHREQATCEGCRAAPDPRTAKESE